MSGNGQAELPGVDVATVPGALVLVTNGIYATGGRAVVGTTTNRVALDKPLSLRSLNGPAFTSIRGYQVPGTTNGDGAVRCVYLGSGASLYGFTLVDGATRTTGDDLNSYITEESGGGVWCESPNATVSDCILAGNSAAEAGGGSFSGTLNNCILVGNAAGVSGGGAFESVLNNCTVVDNQAGQVGGGACGSSGFITFATSAYLNNCILYYNNAPDSTNYDALSVLNYCCTTPQPNSGFGNLTNPPLFIDTANGDLHLQSNSPCINAGNNSFASAGSDLDGKPRVVGGTVDIGAYEFQHPTSLISYGWLQYYRLPTDGSADLIDPDRDGLNNWQEWRCGTDPTNRLSVLRMLSASPKGKGVELSWQSVTGVSYFVEQNTNLAGSHPLFTTVVTNIIGQDGVTAFTIRNNGGTAGPSFYRVGVRN